MSRRRPAWVIAFAGFAAGLSGVLVLSEEGRVAIAQPKAPVIPPAPQAPTLTSPANMGAKRGETIELVLTGTNLADPTAVLLSCPGKVSIPTDNKNGTEAAKLRVKVEVPADCPIGLHTIRVATKDGVSNFRPFLVDELAAVEEPANNRTKETPHPVTLPALVNGRADTEASDYFKVAVKAGQTVTFEVLARRIGSPLDPIIVLHDAKTKRELVELYADDTPGLQGDCRLTHIFKDAGEFLVEVRDTTYRGGADFFYRLRVGEFPGATTAFPVAVQRGKTASVGFAGRGTTDIPPVNVTVPNAPGLAAVYVSPKKSAGISGWPVPVRVNDWPEIAETEPNNDIAKANKLAVPGGVSGRFEKSGDVDHFAVTCKKGTKYAAAAMTYEINSPSEVLIRVLDAKGAEVARSSPAQPNTRVEFIPAADGDYVVACEQLNYLSGPDEIYHLSVQPVNPDFNIVLNLDRCEAPAGDGTAVLATVNRLNGYAGPVDLSIDGGKELSGKVTLPAGQTFTLVPVLVKEGTKPGAYPFRVKGTATAGGATVTNYGTLVDSVKTTLGGMTNPPPEMLTGCVIGVVDKPAFALRLKADPAAIEKGKAGKILIDATREKAADGDIAIAPLFAPPNITATPKPLAKGQTKADFPVTVAAGAASGPNPLVFRATTKVGGKDYAVIPAPAVIDVTEPKKEEPKKKDEPKKDEKKKDEKKDKQ